MKECRTFLQLHHWRKGLKKITLNVKHREVAKSIRTQENIARV